VALFEEGDDMIYFDTYMSPHGEMVIRSNGIALTGLYFSGQRYFPSDQSAWQRDPSSALIRQTQRELAEYYSGTRTEFTLPMAADGTDFQRRVWQAISEVRCGETISYATLAERSGHPGAARAAGAATGQNPISIIVPCHRIVGSNGKLTGYAGGLDRKQALLAHERVARREPRSGDLFDAASMRHAI
jgi:methylated-DNA-[protein]-cysteine S-methyltransferase